jgi:two-component system, cell cycle sensor histidine kinase and response regulator CckA
MQKDNIPEDKLVKLRKRAEELFRKDPSAVEKMPIREIEALVEELQIHQIELDMQNQELRSTQLKLEAQLDKYSDLYDFAPVGYFTISDQGMILNANLTGAFMLGVERKLMIKQPFSRFITSDTQDDYYLHRIKLFKTKGKENCEIKLLKKDGTNLHVHLECVPVQDDEGNIAAVRTVVTDISERKKIEEEKENLETQIRQLSKIEAVGTLSGGIAHDFNNIVGIILGNIELAMDDVPDWNPARLNLDEARTACLRAKSVVHKLLSFSYKTTSSKQPLKFISILNESLGLLRATIPASIDISRNINTTSDIIMADSTQIQQVIINLCVNASQAMQSGGAIAVNLENVDFDQDTTIQYQKLTPGRYVKCTVDDTGHGIKPEILDRIFDPYFTTKEVGEGSGLGLSIVYGIVKNHNGAISGESEPGKGSSFNIFFPVVTDEVEPAGKPIVKLPTGTERILFIDDEQAIVDLAKERIRRLGYQVTATTSSLEGLKIFKARHHEFDLVITDFSMPKMSGDKLAEKLISIRADIPIILCTGLGDKVSGEKIEVMDIQGFLRKPIVMSDFAKLIREVLDNRVAP